MRTFDIFVDLDGVLADFEYHRYTTLLTRGLDALQPAYVTDFYGTQAYIQAYGKAAARKAREIVREPGFFSSMPLIVGGVEGVQALVARGHRVRICSKPLAENPSCTEEKRAWIRTVLGKRWEEEALIVKKKSEYKADFLIDDRPDMLKYVQERGELTPVWKHILFRQPWNQEASDHYRTMSNWTDFEWLYEAERG